MSTERVGIYVETKGGEEALALMQRLDSTINALNRKKKFGTLTGLNQAKNQLRQYTNELERLNRLRNTKLDAGLSTRSVDAAISKSKQNIRDLNNEMTIATQKSRTLGQAMKSTFNSVSSRMQHTGQAFQALGKTLERLSTPMRTLFRSTVWAAGFKALNLAVDGLNGSFERYDIMKNYAKSMKALGLDAERKFTIGTNEAKTAIDNLNDAVLGLPTGLDEIIAAQKVYAGATGEMVTSTKTAIAANNTFLASGMDARGQRFMQKYMVALASGAKLTTNQWQSMARIAPLAMRAVSEELGYASNEYQQFTKDLHSGKVAGEEFLNAFIKVGTEGKVQAAANVMKSTWAGLAANTQNAFRRMGEGILTALDDVFVSINGRNLIQNLLGFDAEGNEVGGSVKKIIDNFSKSLQDWIRSNPEFFIDFIDTLKSIDWGSLVRGMGQGLLSIVETMKSFMGLFAGKDLSLVGRWLAKMPLISKGFFLVGGMLKGMRGFAGGLAALLKIPFFRRSTDGGGIFGMLGKVLGTKSLDGRQITKMKRALDALPTVGQTMRGVVASLSGLMKFAGGTAIAVGTGFIAFKGFKSMFKDLKEIVGILRGFDGVDWAVAGATVVGMAAFIGSFAALGYAISKIPPNIVGGAFVGELILGAFTTLATGILALDMKFIKSAFNSFKEITESLKEGIENLKELSRVSKGTKNLDNLKKAVETYNEILPELLVIGGSARKLKKKNKAVKNVKEIIESVIGILKDLQNLPDFTDEEITKAKEGIKKTTQKISEIWDEIEKEFSDDFFNSVDKAEKGESFMTSVATMISTIVGSTESFKAIQNIEADLDKAKDNILKVKDKMIEIYNEIYTEFADWTVVDTTVMGGSTYSGAKKSLTDATVKSAQNAGTFMGEIATMIENIKNVVNNIAGKEGVGSIDLTSFQEQVNKLVGKDGVISQLKTMYNQLVSPEEGFGGEVDVDIASITEGFNTAIGNIKNAVTGIQEIGAINFEGDGGINSIVTSIKTLIDNLKNAFNAEAIAGLQAQVEAFKAQITAIKTSIESIGSGEGGINVDLTINHTITGDTETVEDLNSAYEAISSARSSIEGLSGSIRINVPISASVTGVNSAVKKMLKAAAKLRAARAILRAAGGGGGNVSAGAYTGGYLAGGSKVLYRASGGDIAFPGKPRGSDTIPLWASRGEFVHNRHAVDFFGIDFMRKINRLDMRGALNDLMTKAGGMASIGRHSVVNNTYNNNQKVIQNINTNSVDFAFKSASRFAGAF